jgi:PAS domain S-box-containing protein
MIRGLTPRFVLASAVLLAIVVGGFLVMGVAVTQLQNSERDAAQSADVLAAANALEKSTLDLETGLRGYLLAGQIRFLAPYRLAIASYPQVAAQLDQLTDATPGQAVRVDRLKRNIDAYVRDWTTPLIALAGRDLSAARRKEATGQGKSRVDAIRDQFAVFTAAQARIGAARSRHADHLGSLSLTLSLAGMGICGLLVLGLALGLRRFVVAPVQRLAAAVSRVGAGQLSVRVREGGVAEVGELTAGFNAMVNRLEEHHDELESQKDELEAQQVEIESALEAVEEEKAHSELLQRIGDELAAVSGVPEVSRVALREIADFARAELGAMYVVAETSERYALAARRGLPSAEASPELEPGEGLAGRAINEGRPVSVSGADTALRVATLAGTRAASHELHLPLRHGDRNVGVVSLGRVTGDSFSADDLAVLAGLAQRAAVALVEALSVRQLESVAHELETLLSSTGEGIYGTDRHGRVTLVNRAALEQTGYTLGEVLGRDAHALLHHTRANGDPYRKQDCPAMGAIDRGEGCRVENEVFWRKDETSFPVQYSAYPLFDGASVTGSVVTFTDISDRKVAERQRDVQHAVTRVLADSDSTIEALPAVLAAVCQGMGWSFGFAWQANEDSSELTCFAMHATPGTEEDAHRLASQPVGSGEFPAGAAMVRRQPVICSEIETQTRTGLTTTPLQSAVAVPILGLEGSLIGVAEFFSRSPVMEAGLPDTLSSIAGQTAQFIERKRGEVETERMRQEFVATVSHELRTPLTAIDGWLHVLLSEEPGALNADQQRFLRTVKRNSDRLIGLVGDLLLAGQIEAGRLSLELDDVDVAELAHEGAELVSATAASKHIELAVDVAGGSAVVVRGDRARLMQLFNNLLSNAVKFTPEGGRVTVAVQAHDADCTVTVTDTGIGIPAADRARLFERFFRASSATENAIAGTGLGLAISKAIAESHGGDIRLADHDGPGTSFVIDLPLAVREEMTL